MISSISACFNVDSYLTIEGPDRVDYKLVISAPQESAFLLGIIQDSLSRFDSVESTIRNDTTYLTAQVRGIPLDSLTGFGFRVERLDENTYRIWQGKDNPGETTQQVDPMLESILKQYRLTLTVVVKSGKVLEHNADEVKGNTYFWKTTMDMADRFSPSITIRFQKPGQGTFLLIGGLLLLIVGAGVLIFMKSRN